MFDGVVDFDKATLDPATGELKAEFVPESTTGGPGDKLHPNRAGYLAMGNAIDLDMVIGTKLLPVSVRPFVRPHAESDAADASRSMGRRSACAPSFGRAAAKRSQPPG